MSVRLSLGETFLVNVLSFQTFYGWTPFVRHCTRTCSCHAGWIICNRLSPVSTRWSCDQLAINIIFLFPEKRGSLFLLGFFFLWIKKRSSVERIDRWKTGNFPSIRLCRKETSPSLRSERRTRYSERVTLIFDSYPVPSSTSVVKMVVERKQSSFFLVPLVL